MHNYANGFEKREEEAESRKEREIQQLNFNQSLGRRALNRTYSTF